VTVSGLAPLDDVKPVAAELTGASAPIMLVGHLPFLERLAGQMLVGDPERAVVRFHNAGIVCLTRTNDRWQVSWIVTPPIAGA
jgi:phosphohistidine phosphatase